MTVFDTSALTRPLFIDADFTATKYEGTRALSQTSALILHPGAPPKTRRTAKQSGQTSLF